MEIPIQMEPASGGSTTIVSDMTSEQILRKAEEDRLAAELMKQEMEGSQLMNLGKILDRAQAATERIERAADSIEIMLEVTQQQTEEIKEQAEEIQEILEPTPTPPDQPEPPSILSPAPEKKRSGLAKFLI